MSETIHLTMNAKVVDIVQWGSWGLLHTTALMSLSENVSSPKKAENFVLMCISGSLIISPGEATHKKYYSGRDTVEFCIHSAREISLIVFTLLIH